MDVAGLASVACETSTRPVAETPVTLGCRLSDPVVSGHRIPVAGEVQHAHGDEAVLEAGETDGAKLPASGRLCSPLASGRPSTQPGRGG